MPESLFTWSALATLGGAAFLTYLIVLYTKELMDRVINMPTDIYAVVVAALVLIAATAFTEGRLTLSAVVLAVANAFLVALAAGQIDHKTLNPPGRRKDGDASG